MTDSRGVEPLPRWVTALDVLTCALMVLAAFAFVTGTGPHWRIAGVRFSFTSEQRLTIAAVLCAGLRHLFFRRPTLLRRLRPMWPALGPALDALADAARSKFETRATRWLWPLLLILLFCAPLFVGLGNADLQNDEAIYSFSSSVMAHSGDWLTPKAAPSGTEPFLEKPPLKFWMVSAPIRAGLLPDNEFGYRFWDPVMGAIAFLYVFAIGRRLAGPLCGFIAVLVLFAEPPLVFDHGLRTNNMEAPLMLCYCGGIYHFLAWRSSETGRRYAHVVAIGLWFVLGFMTKFVAALFLPAVLFSAILLGGDFRRFWRDRVAWIAACAVALALIAPWFIYQHHQYGAGFWRVIVAQHVITRFTASLDPTHLHPWHYYLSEIRAHFEYDGSAAIARAGLALLFVLALRHRRTEAVVLLWLALPLALMSLGTSKLYHYTYPFLPALGLAAGYAAALLLAFAWSLPVRRLMPALARRLAVVQIAAIVCIVVLLPSPSWYRQELAHLSSEQHPLRSLRDCLEPVAARFADANGRGPGVWASGEQLTWPICYYMLPLGAWEKDDSATDSIVESQIRAAGPPRPVVLSYRRYARMKQRWNTLPVGPAAPQADRRPVTVNATSAAEALKAVPFQDGVLLLSGPYAPCAGGSPTGRPPGPDRRPF